MDNFGFMHWNVQKQPPKLFYKKVVLKNLAKFTARQLCQGLFLNKVTGLRTPPRNYSFLN